MFYFIKYLLKFSCTTPRGSGIVITMKKLNEFKSRKEWEQFLWEELVNKLHKSETEKQLSQKLQKLFSRYERSLALKRLTALILINEGLSYTKIGELLWMSPSTISGIKKNYFNKSKSYHGRTKSAKNPSRYTTDFKIPKEMEIEKEESLWEEIKSLRLGGGYTDPKRRWEFLRNW